ncbi:hypothetical protein EYF80_061323 [Liparis tanakae]|uniref:Uncharacterized protein n=1 Tax=Liparis tanakae TaxID=230148 RepID=A0A4Z2EIA1_9TELE|nr:hypothetical protein EYF80_061323 [Liparis tanakae]
MLLLGLLAHIHSCTSSCEEQVGFSLGAGGVFSLRSSCRLILTGEWSYSTLSCQLETTCDRITFHSGSRLKAGSGVWQSGSSPRRVTSLPPGHASFIEPCVPQSGSFVNAMRKHDDVFSDDVFSDGVFSDGVFSDDVFSDDVFSDGVFSDDVFSDDVFSDGVFSEDVFSDDVFSDDVFSDSVFSEDVFSDDVFSDDVFSDDVFFDGVFSDDVFSDDVFSDEK